MRDFSSYKAMLFDVDKTLTNSSKEITLRTKDVIRRLEFKGYKLAICTGRHFATISHVLDIFNTRSFHVVSGGAQVIRSTGEVLWEQLIPMQVVDSLIAVAAEHMTGIILQKGSSLYANEKKIEEWNVNEKNHIIPKALGNFPLGGAPIIVMDPISPELAKELRSRQDCSVKLMRYYDGSLYADITARGISKATGVQRWSQITGVALEDVVGFGDSENDIEFLRSVGYAVAMGNASESVKMIAKEVTADCDHDGVASWIEKNIQ